MEQPNVTRQDIISGFKRLGLGPSSNLIVHASLKSFGVIEGGVGTLVSSMRDAVGTILAPAFTWQCFYFPEGWEKNLNCPSKLTPDEVKAKNDRAQAWYPEIPSTPHVGVVPEAFRKEPDALVGWHPTHRFTAVGSYSEQLLKNQSPEFPLAPITELRKLDGWVLLLGVGHTSNTAIHLAEAEAGRPQWTHWALTRDHGVVECITPSCSNAFNEVEPILSDITRETMIGNCRTRLLPLKESLERIRKLIRQNPQALLCGKDPWCKRAAEIGLID